MIRRGSSTNNKHLMILFFFLKILCLSIILGYIFGVAFPLLFLDIAYQIPFADSNTIISPFLERFIPPVLIPPCLSFSLCFSPYRPPPSPVSYRPKELHKNQTLFHFITNPSRPLLPGRTLPLLPEFSSYIKKSPIRSSYRWLTLHCMFFFFIKAGHMVIFLSKHDTNSMLWENSKLQNQDKYIISYSFMSWSITGKYSETFKPIRLFIYDDIISFSSAIYFLDVHSLCSVYILYSINATRRELSRNVNRKPVLHWNTQTVMEIRTRPTLFCHFKNN